MSYRSVSSLWLLILFLVFFYTVKLYYVRENLANNFNIYKDIVKFCEKFSLVMLNVYREERKHYIKDSSNSHVP